MPRESLEDGSIGSMAENNKGRETQCGGYLKRATSKMSTEKMSASGDRGRWLLQKTSISITYPYLSHYCSHQ